SSGIRRRSELRRGQGALSLAGHRGQPDPRRSRTVAIDEVKGGLQTTIRITIECEGSVKPACVIESLSRWLNG
ncbi:MAG: hypothetical protein ACKOA6_03095, partial [Actinomycetota bacterium]